MLKNTLLVISLFLIFILHIRYLKLKLQIKKIKSQLQSHETYHHSLFIEFFDKDIEDMALEINKIIEANNQILLEMEKNQLYFKNSIADISHDMRTPLTSIIGYLQLLKKSDLDNTQITNLDISLDKAQYLRKLLTDFFEFSSLDANEDTIELKKIDLSGFLSEIILENAPAFSHKKIEPIFEKSHQQVLILADTEMLLRVLQNIISNCLAYSFGNVLFNIYENENITLRIENPTNNIEQISIEHIFDRFYKRDVSRNKKGTGLGLPITKLLMEKMSGSISAYTKENLFVIELVFPK